MTVEHVVFAGCKLDYATLDEIKATGPVLFAGCLLREAALTGCSLPGSLFDDCNLWLTAFGVARCRDQGSGERAGASVRVSMARITAAMSAGPWPSATASRYRDSHASSSGEARPDRLAASATSWLLYRTSVTAAWT